MKRKTLITAGFVIVTVLQGISYPAIALAADSTTADQQEPASSLVTEQSNNTTEGTDTQNETSQPDQAEASSNGITGNEATPKADNGESTGQAVVNAAPNLNRQPTMAPMTPHRQPLRTDGIRTRATGTKTGRWPVPNSSMTKALTLGTGQKQTVPLLATRMCTFQTATLIAPMESGYASTANAKWSRARITDTAAGTISTPTPAQWRRA